MRELVEKAKRYDAESADVWLAIRHVAERYSRTIRCIELWLDDEAVGFPRPQMIRGKRYFRAGELARWERRFSDRLATT